MNACRAFILWLCLIILSVKIGPCLNFDSCGNRLNDQQQKVIDHVLENGRHLHNSAVPFIVYGPFGTGKTLTLAEAAKAAVLHAPKDARVLICTHSNR